MSHEVPKHEGNPSSLPNPKKTKNTSSTSNNNLGTSTMLSLTGENLAIANSDIFFENQRLLLKIKENRENPDFRKPPPRPFQPYDKFPLFSKIPFDVRFMIFAQAAFDIDPRVIEIFYSPKGKQNQFPSKTLVPALMHASSESRAASSLIYERFPTFGDVRSFKDTFVNWEKDILMFRSEEHLKALVDTNSYIIKERALNLAIMELRNDWDPSVYVNKSLKNLEKLYLIRFMPDSIKNKSGSLSLQKINSFAYFSRKEESIMRASADYSNVWGGNGGLKGCITCVAHRDTRFVLKVGKAKKQGISETDEERKERAYWEDMLLAAKLSCEDSATRGTKNGQSQVEADRHEDWDGYDDVGELEDFMSEGED